MANEPLYLGIDLGGTNIKAVIVDEDGHVLGRAQAKTKGADGFDAVMDRIVAVSKEAALGAKAEWRHLAGVGIGAPGPVDPHKGLLLCAVNLGWGETKLADLLSKKLALPVTVDNDVNVGAWGEFCVGAGRGCHGDMLAIFSGTGVGGALILDGDIYHGPGFSAGEIGHTVIQAFAPVGSRTLEELASRGAIARRLSDMLRASHPSVIPKLVDGNLDDIRSKVIAKALKMGDPLTCAVVDDAAKALGVAAANAVTLLSVPTVVLGGGLAEALGDDLLRRVKKSFAESVFPPDMAGRAKLLIGKLGDDAGPVGAALLAVERL